MASLTRNPASARYAATADQSNALLQRQLPTKFNISVATVYKGTTGFIDCSAARARLLREVARPRPVQAPARDQCRCPPAVPAPPNQPMVMTPSEARREA